MDDPKTVNETWFVSGNLDFTYVTLETSSDNQDDIFRKLDRSSSKLRTFYQTI